MDVQEPTLVLDSMSERAQRLHYLVRLVSQELLSHSERRRKLGESIQYFCAIIHNANREAGWWTDLETGEPLARNTGELLMLTVSEVSEADMGLALDLPDDKLPHRKMFEVELADVLIRCGDWINGKNILAAGEFIAAANSIRLQTEIDDDARRVWRAERALMDLVNAVSKVMEADRKGRSLDRLAADVLAITFNIGVQCGLDLAGAVAQKFEYNRIRADHKPENRIKDDGKRY